VNLPRVAAALCGLLLGVTLTACTAESSDGGGRAGGGTVTTHSNVDVDTPQLRALKQRAGVEPCRSGSSHNELPAATLACLGGGPAVRLSSLRGPLVINLFAQWCGPCRSEMPYYQQLHEKAAGRLQVLGIDYLDTRPDLALQLVRATGVTYPLLADPDGSLRAPFGIRGLPGVVLVKRDGTVTTPEFRVVRSYEELRALVQRGLGVTVPR
jgi:thiol-disulfide isomerase/thioredoxin